MGAFVFQVLEGQNAAITSKDNVSFQAGSRTGLKEQQYRYRQMLKKLISGMDSCCSEAEVLACSFIPLSSSQSSQPALSPSGCNTKPIQLTKLLEKPHSLSLT